MQVLIRDFMSVYGLRFSGAGGWKEPPVRSLLAMTRLRKCTDPRDKLYALLGLASPSEKSLIPPDYALTYLEALKNFTIATFRVLKTLQYLPPSVPISGGVQNTQKPSWFHDWSDPAQVGTLQMGNNMYKAAGYTAAALEVSDDQAVLSAVGKGVDVIYATSAASQFDSDIIQGRTTSTHNPAYRHSS